ncbi:hypothetical protein GCM10007973_00210 [Polymorphobacter multimanifer]|uniref:Type II secretory pathway pseudopilin PulG n=1 Tax=Polymorphobacter multimanifer TaxID=1070431 RepID=A0A841L786_9SPHN|nr:histidine kinase [Polymorphobacter multimanifer]MBB6226813.1 type II secretory pathway pseudopilin PulG [Polymorphobacter multimanifer]GGI67059.1 hypothetical protein GCM10007973_00210 [Polymorphobacter multimanifer]
MNAAQQADDAPLVPTRLALLSIAGFWAFYFLINTLRIAFTDQPDQLGMAWRRGIVTLIGIALTAVLWQLLARRAQWSTRWLVGLVFVASAPIAFAYSLANHLVFFVIAPSPSILEEIAAWKRNPDSIWHYIAALAANWYFFVVAWGILYIALAYAGRVQRAERQAARFRAEAQTAQLRALRYQVNPHFLFNTLNSLSAQVMAGRAEDAEAMILNLSTFFRSSLATDPEADVPLADEIALQRLYLDIEQVRFPERLRVEIDVPPQFGAARVPALILQPLVENAVRHGVAMSSAPVTISITARAEGERLFITITDDAAPLGAAPPGNGIGVRNVCARLEARFGSRARCTPSPRLCGGYKVELEMPLEMSRV